MENARILVVEDDRKTAELVALYLRHAGYRVEMEPDGRRALARIAAEAFDLFIFDVMLPGVDGLALCREVRRRGAGAIILLTARVREEERVAGLDLGADDYVPKPFSPKELVARVRAVLRRAPPAGEEILVRGALALDGARRAVTLDGRGVDLTATEFALLFTLARRPGVVLSRAQLLEHLPGGAEETLDRTVDVHVRNLRRKLEADPAAPEVIQTVIGAGYRFVTPDDARRGR
jgi:DNA-binding response OmpR family regulator